MDAVEPFDWRGYVGSLRADELIDLATWLAAIDLRIGELIEIVDRAYAVAADRWRGRPRHFMTCVGRPAAEAYVRRKRSFAGLMAALEDALVSGALPGEVAPAELQRCFGASRSYRRDDDDRSTTTRTWRD